MNDAGAFPEDDNLLPPPPPPAEPQPPPWPPELVAAGAPTGRHGRRWALAASTVAALTAGGLVGWSVSGATRPSSADTGSTTPSGNAAPSNTGGGASTPPPSSTSLSSVDAAVVDITATLSGGRGTVAGTGMVITSSGEVLTNNHVIAGTTSISVQIDGQGPLYHATVLGDDPSADVALLQISGVAGLHIVTLGDSSTVTAGEAITAIGNALGQGGTPSVAGVVTATGQTITASDATGTSETLHGLIQIDAAMVPGDSGGPVVDSAGRVIGITTAGSSSSPGPQADAATTGFAVPLNTAMAVVSQIQSGTATTAVHVGGDGPFLGVAVAAHSAVAGAAVAGVQTGSPAQAAGITAGDVITSVAGIPVSSLQDLNSAMQRLSAGQTVRVTWVDASGGQHSASLQLASGPPL